jgi:hemerythrin
MYQFTDDCRIGIPEIDEEHAKLFDLINLTAALVQQKEYSFAAANSLLAELKEYALTHFAHEERYMEEIHDRELALQKKEHAAFREKIDSYRLAELSEQNGEKVIKELLEYMAKWLYRHILGSDTMIGKFTSEPTDDIFLFSDIYKTGIDFVDQEHQKLFEIIKQANDAVHAHHLHDKYDEIVDIITQLKEYTLMHFTEEESYMEQISYSGIVLQRYAHHSFINRLDEIDLDEMDDNQQEYLEELVEFLMEWLINHIQKMDKKIPKVN